MEPKNPTWKKIDEGDGRTLYQRHRARVSVTHFSAGATVLTCLPEHRERVLHDFAVGEHTLVDAGDRVHIVVADAVPPLSAPPPTTAELLADDFEPTEEFLSFSANAMSRFAEMEADAEAAEEVSDG